MRPECTGSPGTGAMRHDSQGIGGELSHNHKVNRADRRWKAWPFLSTSDTSFRSLPVGQYIRGRFPTPSPHEMEPPPAERVRPAAQDRVRRDGGDNVYDTRRGRDWHRP